MRTIRDPERKRVDEFEDFVGQAQKLWVLDRVDIAYVDFLPETTKGGSSGLSNGDEPLA